MSTTLNPNPQPAQNDGGPGAGDSATDTDAQGYAPYDTKEARAELVERVKVWYKTSHAHWADWNKESRQSFDMVAGHQWEPEDREVLEDLKRPIITMNRMQPFIDTVSGLEIGSRQDMVFLPRQLGSSGKAELLSGVATWARDECDAEDNESEAFRDMLICGLGSTQTRMEYDSDPDGMITIDHINPLEVLIDPNSRKQNAIDARFLLRVTDITLDAAKQQYPDHDIEDLHAKWAEDDNDGADSPHNARLAPFYRHDQSGKQDRHNQLIRLVEVEWWDYEKCWRVLDPATGRFFRCSQEEGGRIRQQALEDRAQAAAMAQMFVPRFPGDMPPPLPQPPMMLDDKRQVFWKAIIGKIDLSITKGADDGGFSLKLITGKRDRNAGVWYGLVRAMRDPQLWANKFFSQALHIVNVSAKGGLLAETDAFDDPEEARNSWAEADSITMLTPGGLAKIQPKEPPQFPAMIAQLMDISVNAIPATSGINMEMVAQQDAVQAGVLEMQRKQQGMTVLATLFNSLRRYRKEQGRLMLWFIKNFIADGRLVRIGGADDAQYVQFVKDEAVGEYDIVVDDAPSSPNMKERTYAAIQQIAPFFMKMNPPPPTSFWMAMLKYTPLPQALVSDMQKALDQASQQAQQAPPMSPVDQAKVQVSQAQAQKYSADAAKSQAQTQLIPAQLQGDLQKTQAEIEHLRASSANQIQNAGIQVNQHTLDALSGLREGQQQAHQRTMDMHGVQQTNNQQALDLHDQLHQHAMDNAQQALNEHQVLNPPEPPTGD